MVLIFPWLPSLSMIISTCISYNSWFRILNHREISERDSYIRGYPKGVLGSWEGDFRGVRYGLVWQPGLLGWQEAVLSRGRVPASADGMRKWSNPHFPPPQVRSAHPLSWIFAPKRSTASGTSGCSRASGAGALRAAAAWGAPAAGEWEDVSPAARGPAGAP